MGSSHSDFLHILRERGFLHQISDEVGLSAQLSDAITGAYIGFDATATSLHVGSLTQIMMLYWFQHTGHRPIVLMGGGTSMIGDPSGKDESRQLMDRQTIESNKDSIKRCFESFLTFGTGAQDAIMIDNADWLLSLNYVDFLRDYGRHLSVNSMLSRDAVKNRLEREQHLSFLEFNYMCLQAYDFVELSRRYDCRLQLGGSDQWGNIVSGIDLGRRLECPPLYGITTPLLETASGAKMGKSADGAIWLNSDLLSPFDFWQYWRNVHDSDVERFLKLFTTLDLSEISKLASLSGEEINEAKTILATEVAGLVHGTAESHKARDAAQSTFIDKSDSTNLPIVSLESDILDTGVGALEFIVKCGFAKSNGEARRSIDGGAIRVNDTPLTDPTTIIDKSFYNSDGYIKLSFGRKRHILVSCSVA